MEKTATENMLQFLRFGWQTVLIWKLSHRQAEFNNALI